jgi:hypothetical protein
LHNLNVAAVDPDVLAKLCEIAQVRLSVKGTEPAKKAALVPPNAPPGVFLPEELAPDAAMAPQTAKDVNI